MRDDTFPRRIASPVPFAFCGPMALSIDRFIEQLTGSMLLSAEDLKQVLSDADVVRESPEQLAHRLLSEKKLTRYQLDKIRRGKADQLVFGSYVIQRELARGGMGEVVLAKHAALKRHAALKLLPRISMLNERKRERFMREVAVLSRLSHPNIVEIYDCDYQHGRLYYAMEYIEGQNLKRLIRQQGLISPRRALDYVLQAARGLACAHAAGVIHRDVKPSNLIVDHSGRIKVLDLGLAFVAELDEEAGRLTKKGEALGTADFAAPEQSMDGHSVDGRSDIYSLGATLYFLLTGRVMYKGGTLVEKFLAHHESPIPDLAKKRSGLPKSVVTLFRTMVAKSPDDRFQTMQELIAAIEEILEGASLSDDGSGDLDDGSSVDGSGSTTHSGLADVTLDDASSVLERRLRRARQPVPSIRIRRDVLWGTTIVIFIAMALMTFAHGNPFQTGPAHGRVTLQFSRISTEGVRVSLDDRRVAQLRAGERAITLEIPADGKPHKLRLLGGTYDNYTVHLVLPEPTSIELTPEFD